MFNLKHWAEGIWRINTLIHSFKGLCLGICIFQSIYGLAQQNETQIGVKGGVSWSGLYQQTEELQIIGSEPGYVVGLFICRTLSKHMAVTLETNLASKGFKHRIKQTGQLHKVGLDYIELPLLIKVKLSKQASVGVGSYGAYLVNVTSPPVQLPRSIGRNNMDLKNFNKLDYGLIADLETKISVLNIGIRGQLGLKDVILKSTNTLLIPNMDKKGKSWSIQLTGSFRF